MPPEAPRAVLEHTHDLVAWLDLSEYTAPACVERIPLPPPEWCPLLLASYVQWQHTIAYKARGCHPDAVMR